MQISALSASADDTLHDLLNSSDHTTAKSNNFLILSEKDRFRYKVWQAFEREGEVNLGARPRFLRARNPLPFSFERLPCTAELIT